MAPNNDGIERKFSDGYFSQDEPNTFLETVDDDSNEIPAAERIFVNQSLDLSEMKCFGFDMDYTLAEYISPQFDELGYRLAAGWMVDNLNYPANILDIKYDPSFAVRGLWFDRKYGNLLKVNQFGRILQCYHGLKRVTPGEITTMYPGGVQKKDENRIFIMNTLFNLAETNLVAALIDYFDNQAHFRPTNDGWTREDKHSCDSLQDNHFTFNQLFQDIRTAVDDIHLKSMLLKKTVMQHTEKFIRKDPRLSPLLMGIRASERKPFLVTNSDWNYVNSIMTFLLGDQWISFFDVIVVDACKPKFFANGTPLKIVDVNTGDLSPTQTDVETEGHLGKIFSGGNSKIVTEMLGALGHDIVYFGDHLYGDIIKCRKLTSWRTVLIVPEMSSEVTAANNDLLDHVSKLENLLANNPKLQEVQSRLHEIVSEFDKKFSGTGSLFRSGGDLTYFGGNVDTWSELYTGSVGNLLGYSLDTRFVPAQAAKLPQE